VEEPGSAAFFITHAQRRSPARKVAAVPVARTYNPVTRTSFIQFGKAHYLASDATREQQRAFDQKLAVAIGDLIVLTAAHFTAGLLYLHALHGASATIARGRLAKAYTSLVHTVVRKYEVDASAIAEPKKALKGALEYYQSLGQLRVKPEHVELHPQSILSEPPVDIRYRKHNAIKFHCNQFVHAMDVVREVEIAAARLRSKE